MRGATGKGLCVCCVIFLLSVASFAAGGDSRVVDAVKQGNTNAVRALIKQHADVNVPQPDGATALAWAAYEDDVEMTDLLIGAGANQKVRHFYIVLIRRPRQCGRAVGLWNIDIGVLLNQSPHRVCVSLLDRVHHSRITARGKAG